MSASTSGRWLIVAAVWLVLVGLAAAAYRLIFVPKRNEEIVRQTRGTDPLGAGTRVALALDGFTGYAVLRSERFSQILAQRSLAVDLVDDKADYTLRLKRLRSGQTPLAVFTIDALLKTSADLGELPGTIVLILDETTGADAIVARESLGANIDALNRADARFVLTPDSPSETLARLVMGRFRLPNLPPEPWVKAKDAADVLAQLKSSGANEPRAFVLWEPYLSQALELPGVRPLFDSGQAPGSIVDVLVVERKYLLAHEDAVRQFVEAYLQARYELSEEPGRFDKLLTEDVRGEMAFSLTKPQLARLRQGIWWKNTQENYAHFGLMPGEAAGGLPQLRDMTRRITDVLSRTGAIKSDPTGGDPERLYNQKILSALQAAHFHPSSSGSSGAGERIRAVATARPLSDAEWKSIRPVGEAGIEPLIFERGKATFIESSADELARLAETMRASPQFYVVIQGQTLARGDAEENRKLALKRAQAAADYLLGAGLPESRIRAETAPADSSGTSSVVKFTLGQLPY